MLCKYLNYRAICGIRGTSLIINMPGSKKAVDECFAAIKDVLPHAIELIRDEKSKTEITHKEIQNNKFVNKVAPILIDSIEVQTPQNPEMIETPPKQENVPVEPTKRALISTETSNPNLSIKSEILLMSENIERTTMSEIIIDDSQLNLSSIKFDSPEKKRSNDQKLKNVIEADYSKIKQPKPDHVCPHKTAKAGDKSDRNSIYPMVEVENALEIIYSKINRRKL